MSKISEFHFINKLKCLHSFLFFHFFAFVFSNRKKMWSTNVVCVYFFRWLFSLSPPAVYFKWLRIIYWSWSSFLKRIFFCWYDTLQPICNQSLCRQEKNSIKILFIQIACGTVSFYKHMLKKKRHWRVCMHRICYAFLCILNREQMFS